MDSFERSGKTTQGPGSVNGPKRSADISARKLQKKSLAGGSNILLQVPDLPVL